MFTLFGSDYVGSPGNCLYPHRFEVSDADSLKEAVRHDYVCAEYKNTNDRYKIRLQFEYRHAYIFIFLL